MKKKKTEKRSVLFNLRVDPDFILRLRQQAQRRGLTLSSYIRQTLTLQLAKDERDHGPE